MLSAVLEIPGEGVLQFRELRQVTFELLVLELFNRAP